MEGVFIILVLLFCQYVPFCFEGRGVWIRMPSLEGSPEFSALLRNRDLEHVRSSTPDQQTRGTGMYAISLLYAHLFHFPPSFYPFSL